MPPGRRKETKPLQKVTIALYRGDMEYLQAYYREDGASKIIRTLVHKHILELEADMPPTPPLEVQL